MDWKRAVMTGIALWALIFFEVSILMFGFKLNAPSPNYYLIHYLLLTAFILVLSLYYFKEKKVKKGLVGGIVLGVLFVIIEIVLDSIITVPLFVQDWGFFFKPEMLASDLLTIVLCGIAGLIKKGDKK